MQSFDKTFARYTQNIIKYYCAISIVITLSLCILSLKWRRITGSLYYLVFLFQVVVAFVPSDQKDRQTTFSIFITNFLYFLAYYTDSGVQIIFTMIVMIFMQFLPHVLLYGQSFTVIRFNEIFFFSVALLLLTSTIAIMIRYISQLHMQLLT